MPCAFALMLIIDRRKVSRLRIAIQSVDPRPHTGYKREYTTAAGLRWRNDCSQGSDDEATMAIVFASARQTDVCPQELSVLLFPRNLRDDR